MKAATKQFSPQEALEKAKALCAAQERCQHEIGIKLAEWGINSSDCEAILNTLYREKYLDEARYAQAYVNDKFRFNKWGRAKIGHMLRQRHISGPVIRQALEQIDEAEYLETLRKLLASKFGKKLQGADYKLRASAYRFAQSRGFESEIISKLTGMSEAGD